MWGAKPPTPPLHLPAHPTFVHERAGGAPASRSFWAAVSRNGVPKGAPLLGGGKRDSWGDCLSAGTLFSKAKNRRMRQAQV